MNTLKTSLRLALPLLSLLAAPRVALACSLAPDPVTVPGSYGQTKAQMPANAPAVGFSVRANATSLVLVGPLTGARSATSPSRVLWTKPTDGTTALPAIENFDRWSYSTTNYYVIPVSGLVAGEYELEAVGASFGGTTPLTITAAAPLPCVKDGVISLATGTLTFVPSSGFIDSCDSSRNLTSRHNVSSTAALPADMVPWTDMVSAVGNDKALTVGTQERDGTLQLYSYSSYLCPHATGVQSAERALRVFGGDSFAKVRVSDNLPACSSATAQTDGAIIPTSSGGGGGCSVLSGSEATSPNYMWSACIAIGAALLGRRRLSAARRA